MGLESSSELFTISVNGVLYLQVRGAGAGGTAWARLGCSGSLGAVPHTPGRRWQTFPVSHTEDWGPHRDRRQEGMAAGPVPSG